MQVFTREDRMQREAVVRNLVAAECALFASLALVVIGWPSAEVGDYGISWYIVHLHSFFVLAVGFFTCDYFAIRAALRLDRRGKQGVLRKSLFVMSVLIVGILFTPYTWNTFFNWAHMTLGATLFSLQLILSFWIVLRVVPGALNWAMIAFQFIGGIGAAVSLPDHGATVLFQGEVIFQLAFSILLIRSVWKFLSRSAYATRPEIVRPRSATEFEVGERR